MARRGRHRICRITIGTQTEHGFASLFPMGDGFGLVWLDGRAMKGGGEIIGGEHGGGGAMSVYFAQFDKAFKQIAESPSTRACASAAPRRPSRPLKA